MTEDEIPTLDAIPAGDGRVKVWCKHCDRWHYHGAAAGHRVAHCPPGTGYVDGYYLRLVETP